MAVLVFANPQARLLEKALSGFDAAAHEPSRWDEASALAPPAPKPAPPPGRLEGKGGIDLAIYLEADRETVRAQGGAQGAIGGI